MCVSPALSLRSVNLEARVFIPEDAWICPEMFSIGWEPWLVRIILVSCMR